MAFRYPFSYSKPRRTFGDYFMALGIMQQDDIYEPPRDSSQKWINYCGSAHSNGNSPKDELTSCTASAVHSDVSYGRLRIMSHSRSVDTHVKQEGHSNADVRFDKQPVRGTINNRIVVQMMVRFLMNNIDIKLTVEYTKFFVRQCDNGYGVVIFPIGLEYPHMTLHAVGKGGPEIHVCYGRYDYRRMYIRKTLDGASIVFNCAGRHILDYKFEKLAKRILAYSEEEFGY